jgi:hypothetical protein
MARWADPVMGRLCARAYRGEPIDPEQAAYVVTRARALGAAGSDIEVLAMACRALAAASSARASFEEAGDGRPGDSNRMGGGRKRRAEEAARYSLPSEREFVRAVCSRSAQGQPLTPAEQQRLREIALDYGVYGAFRIQGVEPLCRAALAQMGESGETRVPPWQAPNPFGAPSPSAGTGAPVAPGGSAYPPTVLLPLRSRDRTL